MAYTGRKTPRAEILTDTTIGEIPWEILVPIITGVASAVIQTAPAMIEGAMSQAGTMAAAQGASDAQILAVQREVRDRILEKERKEKRNRNLMIAGGIVGFGMLAALLIYKR